MDNDSSPALQRQRTERLERRLRKIEIFSVAATLSLVAVLCMTIIGHVYASTPDQSSKHQKNTSFDTITVKRINVVENDGTRRLVLSGATNAPPPIVNGKTLKRLISPAGIIFYDKEGNEGGGIGLARRNSGEQSALVFDYNRAEAIAIVRRQHAEHAYAGLHIYDPPPSGSELGIDGHQRIKVQTVDGKAQVVLNYAKGKPRLRFTVPKRGQPAIEFLDTDGQVTRKISANDSSTGS